MLEKRGGQRREGELCLGVERLTIGARVSPETGLPVYDWKTIYASRKLCFITLLLNYLAKPRSRHTHYSTYYLSVTLNSIQVRKKKEPDLFFVRL